MAQEREANKKAGVEHFLEREQTKEVVVNRIFQSKSCRKKPGGYRQVGL